MNEWKHLVYCFTDYKPNITEYRFFSKLKQIKLYNWIITVKIKEINGS